MNTKRISVVLALAIGVGAAQLIAAELVPGTVSGSDAVQAPITRFYGGHFLGATAEEITFRDQDGINERAFPVDEKAKITRDGGDARLSDLINGDRLKVTTEERLLFKEVAVVIEATSGSQK